MKKKNKARFSHCQPFPFTVKYAILKVRNKLEYNYSYIKQSCSSSYVSPDNLNIRVRPRSPTARARIFTDFYSVSHFYIHSGI